ncbi:MAG: efflux RND transporter periplasmic adaptor subunit [Acidobacteria bacterium]|nr:efflux RND transporter periplasmic adaptor subunit [Acidobacteriota bacterium]MCZ6769784.1 efflux RND transporter periplasmic adaptor subunit [Acidobacteriota bacterium]
MKGQRRYSKRNLLQLMVLFLIPLGGACDLETVAVSDQQEEDHLDLPLDVVELTPESIETADIQVEESRMMDLQVYLETTGVVSPDETRLAHIRPLSRGIVEEVYVRRGDRVREGQPLVYYDNIELGELIGEHLSDLAQLRNEMAQLEVTGKFLERGRELLEAQAIARKEVELREAEYKKAQAGLDSQQAELAKIHEKLHRYGFSDEDIEGLGTAEHSTDHRTASHKILRAPFAGIVIGYDVAVGELVEPDRELLTLVDVSSVWVLANVYEKDLGLIKTGQPVEVVTVAYPEKVFQGRLTYISDLLEKETRTARVRCVMPNPDGALKLEMFVAVKIPSIRRTVAVAVPESAIQNVEGEEVIFVAEEPGHFRKTVVQTGLSADGWIAIDGLAEGTAVVTHGSFYLKSALARESIGTEHSH